MYFSSDFLFDPVILIVGYYVVKTLFGSVGRLNHTGDGWFLPYVFFTYDGWRCVLVIAFRP